MTDKYTELNSPIKISDIKPKSIEEIKRLKKEKEQKEETDAINEINEKILKASMGGYNGFIISWNDDIYKNKVIYKFISAGYKISKLSFGFRTKNYALDICYIMYWEGNIEKSTTIYYEDITPIYSTDAQQAVLKYINRWLSYRKILTNNDI